MAAPTTKQKARRKLTVLAALLALAAISVVAGRLFVRRQARHAFADLSQCLVGDEGATSANVVLRYRRHQLSPRSAPDSAGTDRGPCDKHAQRLRDWTSTRLFAWHAREVSAAFDDVVSLLQPDLPTSSEPAPLTEDERRRPWGGELKIAWAVAEREGLTGGVSSVVAEPQAEVLTLDDLGPSLLVQQRDRVAGLSASGLFGGARPGFASSRHYCWATADTLSCVERAYEPPREFPLARVRNTTALGRSPLYTNGTDLFLANTPDRPIETLASSTDESVSSWVGEGDLAVVASAEKGKPVVSIHSRGKLQRIDFDAELPRLFGAAAPLRPAELGPVRAAFGYLYFLGKRRGGTQLYAVRVGDDGVLAPLVELATVTTPEPGWQVDIAACNPAGDERIVIVTLADETFVVFTGEGKPTTTVHSGEMHGVYKLHACSRGRVLLGGGGMGCTPKGCALRERFEVNPSPQKPPFPPQFASAETLLGDNTAYVWGAKQGWRGGLQMKLALGAELGRAPARTILDDLVDGGELYPTGRVRAFELFGGTTEALLVVGLDDGRELALRIDADGSVRPEKVEWTEP